MYRHDYRKHYERSRSKKHRYYGESSSTGLCFQNQRKHRKNDYQRRNKRKSRSPSLTPQKSEQRSSELGSPLQSNSILMKISGEVEHIALRKGDILNEKYRVLAILGDGTFGRVVECQYRGVTFAVKIIKPVQRYIDSAKIERSIVKRINRHDPNDEHGIVRYKQSFYYKEHFCMVFKPLGKSLYEFIKMNSFQGFPMKMVQSFFKQILHSVGYLHKIGYTHTDLKPQNILLESPNYEQINNPNEYESPYYLPESDKIRIIDFGGATKHDEYHSPIINTRQYRSPQVILQCCEWNEISDVWSIGCIIVQLLSGRQLFPTKQNREHLAMIEKNCGKYPGWMIHKIPIRSELKKLFLDGFVHQDSVPTLEMVIRLPILEQLIDGPPELIHLLRKCLEIDPNKRYNCMQAERHPFFQINF